MTDELNLEFTSDELYLLFGMYGPAIAFGLGDPYLGKFIEEFEAAQRAALQSLVERDFIRLSENGEAAIDEVLAKILETCAKPKDTVVLTTQGKGHDKEIRYIHFGSEMLVEHTPLAEMTHRLVPLPPNVGRERLESILNLNGQAPAPGGVFSLDDETLFRARDTVLSSRAEEAVALLVRAGLKIEQAQQLVKALTNAVSNSSVVVILNRDDPEVQHVNGVGVLASAEGLWALNLHPNKKETRIEFVPSSATEIANRLQALLPLR